jgi:predicted helicase
MAIDHRAELQRIRTFPALIAYLRNELGWPIESDDFEELTFDYTPDELGIDSASAAKIQEIKRLRPLSPTQPWGIFFVKFEPKQLPVVALRRILSRVVLKKRASSNSDDRAAWAADDLLFVSNFGRSDVRQISFAHFSQDESRLALPVLKVLGWDNQDTQLHLDHVVDTLHAYLSWPDDEADTDAWRTSWRAAFTLRHREVIATSKLLAVRLAELARSIRDRIAAALAIETDDGVLTTLMHTFREALVHDLDADGFADMYAQTIAYGLLSARIAHPSASTVDDFAGHMRTNPFLRELMESFLSAGGSKNGSDQQTGIDFDELGINEVIDLLDDAKMEAILRDFGDRNPQEDPVIHFYELFLKEYDAKQRMQRGVFYTPRPVVSYIVRSVDECLRTDFGLEDGLADTATWGEIAQRNDGLKIATGVNPDQAYVEILDPATGTGTFLVEVVDVIHRTMVAKWKSQGYGDNKIPDLWNDYVPNHLLPRLHGYELLMAPYAIAHLKIGLKLHETGYRFESDERARVYLTNALEPARDFSDRFAFAIPALAHEAEAVNAVKRDRRFTVVIGNPPYSLMSANLEEAHRKLVEPYKFVDGERIRERGALQLEKNIQDDYVKFIRLGQTQCDAVPLGVLALVTNHTYLDNPTLRGMRNSLLATFDGVSVLDLHGNTKRKEASPVPGRDENVFDIQQGVAIGLFVRHIGRSDSDPLLRWGELWGSRESKYAALLGSSAESASSHAFRASPPLQLFVAQDEALRDEFDGGFAIDEMFTLYSTGIATARDKLTVHRTKEELESVVDEFARLEPEQARERFSLGPDTNDWKVALAQADLRRTDVAPERMVQVLYRPFDRRWTYYTGQPRGFLCNPRRPVMQHLLAGPNVALCVAKAVETGHGFAHAFVTDVIADHHSVSLKEVNYVFPLFVYPEEAHPTTSQPRLELDALGRRANFSPEFREAVEIALGSRVAEDAVKGSVSTEAVFGFIYSVLFAPSYRARYAGFLRKEFARIRVPQKRDFFLELSRLGSELVALHLAGAPKSDVGIAAYSGARADEVGRVGWSDETIWVDASATKKGQAAAAGTAGFRGVPEAAWEFHIGGYRVLEKWLKDRKGRTLSDIEIAQYQRIAMTIVETLRIMREIDAIIDRHGGWPHAFSIRS